MQNKKLKKETEREKKKTCMHEALEGQNCEVQTLKRVV